jgi:hypothetical protein
MTIPVYNYQLSQCLTDLQALLGDFGGTRFSTAQLTDAINYSIKQMNTLMGYTYTDVMIPQTYNGAAYTHTPAYVGDQNSLLVPTWVPFSLYGLYPDNSTSYDLTDYIEVKIVLFGYGNLNYASWPAAPPFTNATIPLNKTSMEQEDIYNPNWRTTYGVPQRWDFYDSSRIVTFPQPYQQQTSGNLNGYLIIGYVQTPALLSNLSDYVDDRIPDRVQQYIKYGAASWLLSLDQSDATSLTTAKQHMDTFTQLLQAKSITP